MLIEQFRWLAGVIAAHKNGKIIGRTRLQKTVYLLQRSGLTTDFPYSLHFYGPYSEGLNTGVRLAEQFELVEVKQVQGTENEYYTFEAKPDAALGAIEAFRTAIEAIQKVEDVPLELAATYDAFRQMGYGHEQAIQALRQKKGRKCTETTERSALDLLQQLGLPAA